MTKYMKIIAVLTGAVIVAAILGILVALAIEGKGSISKMKIWQKKTQPILSPEDSLQLLYHFVAGDDNLGLSKIETKEEILAAVNPVFEKLNGNFVIDLSRIAREKFSESALNVEGVKIDSLRILCRGYGTGETNDSKEMVEKLMLLLRMLSRVEVEAVKLVGLDFSDKDAHEVINSHMPQARESRIKTDTIILEIEYDKNSLYKDLFGYFVPSEKNEYSRLCLNFVGAGKHYVAKSTHCHNFQACEIAIYNGEYRDNSVIVENAYSWVSQAGEKILEIMDKRLNSATSFVLKKLKKENISLDKLAISASALLEMINKTKNLEVIKSLKIDEFTLAFRSTNELLNLLAMMSVHKISLEFETSSDVCLLNDVLVNSQLQRILASTQEIWNTVRIYHSQLFKKIANVQIIVSAKEDSADSNRVYNSIQRDVDIFANCDSREGVWYSSTHILRYLKNYDQNKCFRGLKSVYICRYRNAFLNASWACFSVSLGFKSQ